MTRALLVAMLALCATTAHAGPPTVDDAIAHAAAAKKPLVLDFGAAWCRPCREMDKVFARPEIQQRLADIDLVRYDIEVPPGDTAAVRFNIHTFPTLVVVAMDGSVVAQRSGYLDATALARFLDDARAHTLSTAELEASVAAHPNDLALRAKLASHFRAIGRIDDALDQYRTIVQQAGPDRTAIAQAAAAIDDITAAEARVKTVVDDALVFVDAYPDSPLASERLALLAASNRIEKLHLDDLARRHLAAVPPQAFAEAVRTSLFAGATAEAGHALSLITAPTPTQRLLAAEVAVAAGGIDVAKRIATEVCSPRPPDLELACLTLEEVLHMARPTLPGVALIAARARRTIQSLESPSAGRAALTLPALGDIDAVYGNALAKMLRDAIAECARYASRPTRALFAIEATHVHVYGVASSYLRGCLERNMIAKRLPTAPAALEEDGIYATLTIDPRRTAANPFPLAPQPEKPPVRNVQLLVYGTARSGGAPAPDVGVRTGIDILHFGEAWLTSTLEGELGSGDSSLVRAALGLRFEPQHAGASIAVLGGWGRTHFGDVAPVTTEAAFEMRGGAHFANAQIQAWLRMSRLLGSTSTTRMHASGDGLRPDEVSGGLGVSIPLAGHHLYAGFAYEHRSASDDYVIEFGIPILDRF